jgi:hypothetical protein
MVQTSVVQLVASIFTDWDIPVRISLIVLNYLLGYILTLASLSKSEL